MPERPNGAVLKTADLARGPGVRIPLSPPFLLVVSVVRTIRRNGRIEGNGAELAIVALKLPSIVFFGGGRGGHVGATVAACRALGMEGHKQPPGRLAVGATWGSVVGNGWETRAFVAWLGRRRRRLHSAAATSKGSCVVRRQRDPQRTTEGPVESPSPAPDKPKGCDS